MAVSSRRSAETGSPGSRVLRYPVSSEGFGELLDEMRMRAGLSVHEIARLWDVKPNALYQYFHKKRGRGGPGTLRWFLRFASACGCEVTVTFPRTSRGQEKVVLSYGEEAEQAGSDGTGVDDSVGRTHRGGGQVFLGRGDARRGVDRV